MGISSATVQSQYLQGVLVLWADENIGGENIDDFRVDPFRIGASVSFSNEYGATKISIYLDDESEIFYADMRDTDGNVYAIILREDWDNPYVPMNIYDIASIDTFLIGEAVYQLEQFARLRVV